MAPGMKVYGNHCNAGTIHREMQPEIAQMNIRASFKKYCSKTIIRIEDWKPYASYKVAMAENHVSLKTLKRALADPKATAGGYHWRYA